MNRQTGSEMEAEDRDLLEGYIRNISPPLIWVDWYFRFRDTPAGNALAVALFDDGITRDLTSQSVRADVLKCVTEYAPLFDYVLELAREAEDQLAEYILNYASANSKPESELPYRCGLRRGQAIVLKNILPIFDSDNNLLKSHQPGEVWTVAGHSLDQDIILLREPDGSAHTWNDDASIFEYFEESAEDVPES